MVFGGVVLGCFVLGVFFVRSRFWGFSCFFVGCVFRVFGWVSGFEVFFAYVVLRSSFLF